MSSDWAEGKKRREEKRRESSSLASLGMTMARGDVRSIEPKIVVAANNKTRRITFTPMRNRSGIPNNSPVSILLCALCVSVASLGLC